MKIAIIGCGASGMTAAISAIRNGAGSESITIYEAFDRPGRKILATGNGRCNLGNECLEKSSFYTSDGNGDEFLSYLIHTFSVDDLKKFFESLGVITCSKNGYMYPRSMQASTVLNALIRECNDAGVCIRYSSPVSDIKRSGEGLILTVGGKEERADRVIVASGFGSGGFLPKGTDVTELLKGLGIHVKKPLPALCGLKTSDKKITAAGVRAAGKVTLLSEDGILGFDEGEIQFTKETVSGIPVFQISRLASVNLSKGKRVYALLDMMTERSYGEIVSVIRRIASMYPERSVLSVLEGILNNKLAMLVLERAQIPAEIKASDLKDVQAEKIVHNIKELRFEITGTEAFEKAQTMCGGVPVGEIDKNCSLKSDENIFITGELLDIDGKCGGYNLYLAWATGLIAGRSAVK